MTVEAKKSAEVAALLAGLPGAGVVLRGLEDLIAGRVGVDACLVAINRPNLVAAGIEVELPPGKELREEPELVLYRLLGEEGGDVYGRYNSLLRELASFTRALRARLSREQ